MTDSLKTTPLYYDDPYLVTFHAKVVGRDVRDGKPAVALDRTAFYPEGGGQPGDRGTLNGVRVQDTQEEAGLVWHILEQPVVEDGVAGEVDWERRFDFMQQHHGQHLLSAAFERLCDARTVSVHLGEEICTVDLLHPGLAPDQLVEAEELTNRVIWENLPVQARFVERAELEALALRKQPGAYERIRIVSAGDFDHSPCGGAHPRRTGEVGSVVLRRWERRGETLRVEFLCGARVVRDYRWKNALLAGTAGSLSIGAAELPAAIERLRDGEERSRKALVAAQEQLVGYEAAELLAQARGASTLPIVARIFEGREVESLRRLAGSIAAGGGVALLGLRGPKAQLVFARAEGLPYDMGAALREAVALIGGRGGGRPEAAQGGGPDTARLDEAIEHARQLVLRVT